MKRETIKKIIALASVLTIGLGVTGCSSDGSSSGTTTANNSNAGAANNSADNSGAGNDTSSGNADSTEVKTIRVGSGNAMNPACFLDENGEPVGYEYDVLKAIDELLPQYEFTYETFDFQNVLLALESNKIDLAAHQYEWNVEREENYLFAEEGYTEFSNYAWVPVDTDTTNINSLEDFAGQTVWPKTAGSATAYNLELYNQAHPDKQLILDYTTPASVEELMTYYATGRYAFFPMPEKDVAIYNDAYKDIVTFKKAFDEPINRSYTYYLYRKDDPAEKELQEAVDEALRELRASGKLREISIKWWDADYTGDYDAETGTDRYNAE